MSEYQRVVFRALTQPVSPENLKFMRQQSSRAEVTPLSFDCEYDYSDFRGNTREMLRRGYDFHFHYANFGTRTLMIRLPSHLPFVKDFDSTFARPGLELIPDKDGAHVTLCLNPSHDAGSYEDIWELDDLIERLIPLRAELINGDLRPLYLAAMAIGWDDDHDPEEELEAPVPAGLSKPTDAQLALGELYELDGLLIAAAAQASPPLPQTSDPGHDFTKWLQTQPEERKDRWLSDVMGESAMAVRTELLAKYRIDCPQPLWETASPTRTLAQIEDIAKVLRKKAEEKARKQTAKKRLEKLASLKADPDFALQETERLVKLRTTAAYEQIATLLADLREALQGTAKAKLPEQQAQKLKAANPKLYRLTHALRDKGFVPK